MIPVLQQRWLMVLTGMAGGLFIWGMLRLLDEDAIDRQLWEFLFMAGVGLFTTFLALCGPTPPKHALKGAGLSALTLGLLSLLVSLRYDPGGTMWRNGPHSVAFGVVLLLPLPFLIAAAGAGAGGWRSYPSLFEQSWSAIVRGSLGWIFAGILWGVIFLSDALLGIVGIHTLGDLIEWEPMLFVVTGLGLGLGLAVAGEVQHLIPSRLVVRLLRLLTPVVLAVSVVFLLGVLVQGVDAVFKGFSAASVILTVASAAIMLVSLVVDMDEAEAPLSPVLRLSGWGLAVLVAPLSALAGWAVLTRVAQYGWTPDRLLVAVVAGFGLLYGLAYLLAALRKGAWMAQVRRANLWLALGALGAAILWLTPVLDAERISAASQKRLVLAADPLPSADLIFSLQSWGLAGEAALADLQKVADAGQREDIAQWLKFEHSAQALGAADLTALRSSVVAALPLQPASATGTRDITLESLQQYELEDILAACQTAMPGGAPGCVMVVADLAPGLPGEEAVLALSRDGWATIEVLLPADGYTRRETLQRVDGTQATQQETTALIEAWQKAPPPLTPVMLNQLGTGPTGYYLSP